MTNIEVIKKRLKTEDFYIYGGGFSAERFLRVINSMGVESHIKGVIQTHRNSLHWNGYSVFEPQELKESRTLIVISVHYINYEGIKLVLDSMNKEYLFVFPYLLELEIGEPVASSININVNDVIKGIKNIYGLASYYLMVRGIVESSYGNVGLYAYRSYHSMFGERNTNTRREEAFIKRIKEYKEGKIENYSIKLTSGGEYLIDGTHRLALAKYFGEETITCDYFKDNGKSILIEKLKTVSIEQDVASYFSTQEFEQMVAVINEWKCG